MTFTDPDDMLDAGFFRAADVFAAAHPEIQVMASKQVILDEARGRIRDRHPRKAQFARRQPGRGPRSRAGDVHRQLDREPLPPRPDPGDRDHLRPADPHHRGRPLRGALRARARSSGDRAAERRSLPLSASAANRPPRCSTPGSSRRATARRSNSGSSTSSSGPRHATGSRSCLASEPAPVRAWVLPRRGREMDRASSFPPTWPTPSTTCSDGSSASSTPRSCANSTCRPTSVPSTTS